MSKPFLAAAVQMSASLDKEANLRAATRLVEEAARRGAEFVSLPELFNAFGPLSDVVALAEPIPGPTSVAMSGLARRLRITLVAGSICQRGQQPGRGYNTSLLLGPDGAVLATYRKIHLFDANVPGSADAPGVRVEESRYIDGGDDVVVAATSLCRIGLSICYDLRFPELYRRLSEAGADVIGVPAAFTFTTGRDHWATLLSARAIENQAYVVAANQFGRHASHLRTYGHSRIIDPWGTVLATAGADEETVIIAEIDPRRIAAVRAQLPALVHRRIFDRPAEE